MKILLFLLPLALFFSSCSKNGGKLENPEKLEKKDEISSVPADKEAEPVPTADAKYRFLDGFVQHKRKDQMVWSSSELETPLFYKDWVKTGDGAQTQIDFRDERSIFVKEKSILILLGEENKSGRRVTSIGVTAGDIRGEVGPSKDGPQDLLFKFPEAWVRISSGLKKGVKNIIKLSLTSKEIKVHAVKGEVSLEWENRTMKIAEDSKFERTFTRPKGPAPEIAREGAPPAFDEVEPKEAEEPAAVTQEPVKKVSPHVVEKKKEVSERPVIKGFKIIAPENKSLQKGPTLKIVGVRAADEEVFFQGKNISEQKFSRLVPLEKGINHFTFQIIKNDNVTYYDLEITGQ